MENKEEMLTDEQLGDVAGGGGASPTVRAFDIGEVVYIRLATSEGKRLLYIAIVEDCLFDEIHNTWTYKVRFGTVSAGVFTVGKDAAEDIYYPQYEVYRY